LSGYWQHQLTLIEFKVTRGLLEAALFRILVKKVIGVRKT
jgi:hypothetical protein